MREQRTGSADHEGVIDLRCHVPVIEGRCDQPRLETGEVVNDERGTIGHQRSDPITRPQPQTEQTDRQAIAEVIERAPRPARIRRDQREPVRIGIQAGAKQTAGAHRPLQRPPGIPSHAATPLSEINIETPSKRTTSRPPNLVRLVATARAAQAVPGPLPHGAIRRNARARQSMGAEPKRRRDPTMRARRRSPPVAETGAVDRAATPGTVHAFVHPAHLKRTTRESVPVRAGPHTTALAALDTMVASQSRGIYAG